MQFKCIIKNNQLFKILLIVKGNNCKQIELIKKFGSVLTKYYR